MSASRPTAERISSTSTSLFPSYTTRTSAAKLLQIRSRSLPQLHDLIYHAATPANTNSVPYTAKMVSQDTLANTWRRLERLLANIPRSVFSA